MSRLDRSRGGVTLVELVVVIGLIAVLTGVVIVGLRGDQTQALADGQGTVASLLSATRGQAALRGTNARLLVNANPENRERFLRYIVIEVQDPGDPDRWVAVDAGVTLPVGVAVLPKAATTVGNPDGVLAAGMMWNLSSTVFGTLSHQPIHSAVAEDWLGVAITARGTIARGPTTGLTGAGPSGSIILGTYTAQPPGGATPLMFDNPDNVRGMTLSSYGIATLVHDRTGF